MGRFTKALFGTNPIAFSAPRENDAPMVIDMSLSKVARGKVMVANQQGEKIPEGWAIDNDGKPTTDPKKALEGCNASNWRCQRKRSCAHGRDIGRRSYGLQLWI